MDCGCRCRPGIVNRSPSLISVVVLGICSIIWVTGLACGARCLNRSCGRNRLPDTARRVRLTTRTKIVGHPLFFR